MQLSVKNALIMLTDFPAGHLDLAVSFPNWKKGIYEGLIHEQMSRYVSPRIKDCQTDLSSGVL